MYTIGDYVSENILAQSGCDFLSSKKIVLR